MDIDGFERLLRGIELGAVRITVRDLTQPSPLALEVLSARPYAYLDDAPLEERRTQAVMARRWMSPQQASDLGRLDPEAIARVRSEAWPEAENADELHDALVWLGVLTSAEVASNPRWSGWLVELAAQKRAAHFDVGGSTLWIAAERLPHFRALWPKLKTSPALAAVGKVGLSADARSRCARGYHACIRHGAAAAVRPGVRLNSAGRLGPTCSGLGRRPHGQHPLRTRWRSAARIC